MSAARKPLRGFGVSLPSRPTNFVGRTAERDQVVRLASFCKLVTILGPGGVGKTRLAAEVASLLARHRRVIWTDLAPAGGNRDALAMLAAAADLLVTPSREVLDLLRLHLVGSDDVLVLDNSEHLTAPLSQTIAELLAACPALTIITTSRQPFGLGSEVTFRLPAMTVPPPGEPDVDLMAYDGTRLFVDRAGATGLRVRAADAPLIAEICRRLDGMPLAIELAASGAASSSLRAVLDGLTRRPELKRSTSDRHGSIEASLAWSYELLDEAQQAALRALAACTGPFTEETARVVTGDPAALAALAERSIVAPEPAPFAMTYRLLDTVERFAVERTNDAELTRARVALLGHAREVAVRAEAGLASPAGLFASLEELDLLRPQLIASIRWGVEHGKDPVAADIIARLLWYWIARGLVGEVRPLLERARARADAAADPSRRGAWLWAAGRLAQYEWDREQAERAAAAGVELARASGDVPLLVRSLVGLGWLGMARGNDRDACRPLFQEAAEVGASSPEIEAFALEGLASIPMSRGDWKEAMPIIERSTNLARAGNPLETLMDDYIWFPYVALMRGDDAAALAILREASPLAERLNASFHRSAYRSLEAIALTRRDEIDGAKTALREANDHADLSGAPFPRMLADASAALHAFWTDRADAVARLEDAADLGARSFIMHIAGSLLAAAAELAALRGDAVTANRLIGRAHAWRNDVCGTDGSIALAEAALASRQDDLDRAVDRCHAALSDAVSVDAVPLMVDGLEQLAAILTQKRPSKTAVRLLGAAAKARAARGWARAHPRRRWVEATLARARDRLDRGQVDALLREGASLTPQAAIAYVQRGRGGRKRPLGGWDSLTPAEVEVVRLAAAGSSNAAIAERLFVSRATVKTHLVHVYAKLGLSSRSVLVSEAVRRGMGDAPAAAAGNQPSG